MASKETLHHLIDRLPQDEVPSAERYLEFLCSRGEDRVAKMLLDAPEDDESTTPEENRSAEEAWQEYRQGKGRNLTEVRKDALVD